jgi:putative thioredoxin
MNDIPFVVDIQDAGHFEQQVIEASKQQPVLVDFWADWCQPCQILIPLLTKLAEEYQGAFILAKVNSDQQQELAQAAGVRNLPTVKLFKDGQIVDEFMGAKPEGEIRQFLDAHIETETGAALQEAKALAEAGQFDQSIELLKALNAQDPSNTDVYLAIAKVYLQAEDIENCEAVLNALPANVQISEAAKQINNELALVKATQDAPEIDELINKINSQPNDYDLKVQLANQYIVAGQYDSALEVLLQILTHDINYQEGSAKAAMLTVFERLGAQDPLTRKYRSKLASLLY